MHTITRDSLLTLEAYARQRPVLRAGVIAHRRLRSLALGEHMTLQFEDHTTLRYQIQEMLRIEKIFEEAAIQQELAAYLPLLPEGSNWKATLLLEYPDPQQRRRELARLIGVADRLFVEVAGHPRVYAVADEDIERDNAEKTSAVHFLRFELPLPTRQAVRAGAAVQLGCDHVNYQAQRSIPADTLASLIADLA